MMGILLPAFFNRIGVDPAITAGPFITAIQDVTGLILYLGLATLFLPGFPGELSSFKAGAKVMNTKRLIHEGSRCLDQPSSQHYPLSERHGRPSSILDLPSAGAPRGHHREVRDARRCRWWHPHRSCAVTPLSHESANTIASISLAWIFLNAVSGTLAYGHMHRIDSKRVSYSLAVP